MVDENKPWRGLYGIGAALTFLARLAEGQAHNAPSVNPAPYNPSAVASNGRPYITTISGHSASGKHSFYDGLRARMATVDFPVEGVINYKSRGPRATEVVSVDYIPVESDKEFRKLVEKGEIIVPYTHDGRNYGLSRVFLDALQRGNTPLMITDVSGLVNLLEYLRSQRLPNRVISFMLHTSKADAAHRLIERAGRVMGEAEIKEIQSHMEKIEDEFELYRGHEYLFRHVLRNNTVEGVSQYDRIQYLTNRAMQIIGLEGKLNAVTVDEFREAYVGEVVKRLFDTSPADLVGSISQGVQLRIQDELIQKYSHERGIDQAVVREVARRDVISSANHYGIISFYLEAITKPEQKRILVDLIEAAVGLSHQYRGTDVHPSRESRFSLTQLSPLDKGLIDFHISFSPYDPMRTPREDSRIHTLTFESVLYNRSPRIEVVPSDKAKKFIEGNGSS